MQVVLKQELAKLIGTKKLALFGVSDIDIESNNKVIVDLDQFSIEKVKQLQTILQEPTLTNTTFPLKDIQAWLSVLEEKTPKLRKLEHFKSALIKFLINEQGKRIFVKDINDDDVWKCYRITRIVYVPHEYMQRPHVVLTLVSRRFNILQETKTEFYGSEVVGRTVPEILAKKGIFLETQELRVNYLKEVERFRQLYPLVGKQFLATGIGTDDIRDDEDHYRWDRTQKFDFDNHKCIIDIFKESDKSQDNREGKIDLGAKFWKNPFTQDDEFEEDEPTRDTYKTKEEQEIEIPIHTYVVVFDLARHLRLSCHVNYLTEYVYDKTLSEKLVLPNDVKQLVQILIEHKEGGFKDIIQNKAGGAIVLLSGKAGTGKTLTAEVFAESKEKPLYSVQASQLGIEVADLERELMEVLKRTARWKAILLLDEADVYVHSRGNDLNQNAIVGVFLRVLEYHSSILFMTTNRPDIVDDAIASRCIARIDYVYPDKEQQKQIWRILADSSGFKLSAQVIDDFVEKNNNYSGRDIKNLLKLANLKANAINKEIDVEIIEYVTKFNPTLQDKESVV